jgi:enoyl-CoA hydratase/carnithine racemase
MPTLERDGEVFVLDLGDGENRFHPDWVAGVSALLDEVAAAAGPRGLVTSATGKFWSNGLDLDWLGAHPDELTGYVVAVQELLARVLVFPAPTVAAVQGHAFAGGAMLALAHDWRVMRADRGFFSLPEADIRIPFTPGMTALIMAKLSPSAATDAMTTARRYGGDDALKAGIVTATADEGQVLATAVERVRPLAGKDPVTLGVIKQRMYGGAVAELRDSATSTLTTG